MTKAKRAIVGAVIQGGKTYVAGDEDALAAAMAGKSMARLVEKGVVTGGWEEAEPAEQPAGGEQAEEPAPAKTTRKAASRKGR